MTEVQWISEGVIHFKAGRYQQAVAAYEQAIRLNPHYITYHLKAKALEALETLESYTEAVAAYEQAIGLAPNDADTKANLYAARGVALFTLSRNQEALTAFEQAIQLVPKVARFYGWKGATLKELDRYKEALAAYEQAIRLDPTEEGFRNGRERVLQELGRSKGVGAEYWVVRRGPRDKDSRGNFHSMEKYAGPFSTREEAQARAQEARNSFGNLLGDLRRRGGEGYADELKSRFGSVFLETDYVVLSENELEEARRRGIRIY